MEDNAGLFYVTDGAVRDSSSSADVDTAANRVVYEVIRIIDGVPLFFEDHFERMARSSDAIGRTLGPGESEMKENIKLLLSANGSSECNVKVMSYEVQDRQKLLLYISRSYYPSGQEILEGVPTGLLKIERNDPNAKVINTAYKEAVNARIREGGFFEVLLVNSGGFVTEGSKSNVFFTKGDRIYTAPGASVLRGVTRKHVFEACSAAGLDVTESLVGMDELGDMEGAFLSGTSIKVLPVSSIEDRVYSSSALDVIISVRNEYDRLLKNYIEGNVKIW